MNLPYEEAYESVERWHETSALPTDEEAAKDPEIETDEHRQRATSVKKGALTPRSTPTSRVTRINCEKEKPLLTKPLMSVKLRTVPTEDPHIHRSNSSESRPTTVPKGFARKTVWKPKGDHQKEHENTIVNDREKYCQQVLETGTFRISPHREETSPRRPFAVPGKDGDIPSRLERVIDLSFLPPQSEEQVEKITERLSRVKPKPTPAVAEPTPPLDHESTAQLLARLTLPSVKKQNDMEKQRYEVIEPRQREQEEIDVILRRLCKQNPEPEPRFKSKAAEKKISTQQSQELVNRLFDKNFFKKREQAALKKYQGVQSKWVQGNSNVATEEFFKMKKSQSA